MGSILVTGAAGFIGFHLCKELLRIGENVIGLDNLNPYYDVQLKRDRLSVLLSEKSFRFIEADLADVASLEDVFKTSQIDKVVNLAAQAGVRYSLENPGVYVSSNLVGFSNLLECCRNYEIGHLVYASSSSVYGANESQPFTVGDTVDHPVSLYAATKKSNELLAHSYSHLYGLPTTGLRFFTVYGPWGRPDMALYSFTESILEGRPIKIFNHGKMKRDFTYVDDITQALTRIMNHIPKPDESFDHSNPNPSSSSAPYSLHNIGNGNPVELGRFISVLEATLGVEAQKELLPLQPGDVLTTYADVSTLHEAIGFKPETPIEEGIASFVRWYREYHQQ